MVPSRASSKPLAELRTLAAALGWRGIQMCQHAVEGSVITWYSTTDRKFFLQINEQPPGQTATYCAAVHADRYGICTPWISFASADPEIVESLRPFLQREQFKDRCWRREFCAKHPACCIESPTPRRCTAARLRGEWPPEIE